jgi:hypothetical protein
MMQASFVILVKGNRRRPSLYWLQVIPKDIQWRPPTQIPKRVIIELLGAGEVSALRSSELSWQNRNPGHKRQDLAKHGHMMQYPLAVITQNERLSFLTSK